MKLLDLPPELVISIADSLDRHSLNSLVKTTRCLHTLLTHVLNQRLSIPGETLLWASEHNSLHAVKLALSMGAVISYVDGEDHTALHLAALYGNPEVAALLLSMGAETELVDYEKRTTLHIASYSGCADTTRLLLEQGAKIEAEDNDDLRPLQLAARYGHTKVVQVLLEYKASINDGYDVNETPLHWAVVSRCQELVELLLDAGALINAGDKWLDDSHKVDHLLQPGIGQDSASQECLDYSMEEDEDHSEQNELDDGDTDRNVLENMLEYEDQDQSEQDDGGESTLEDNESEKSEAEGTEYTESSSEGVTDSEDLSPEERFEREIDFLRYIMKCPPLHWAIKLDDPGMVKLLLSYGADVCSQDAHMRTPIVLAAKYGASLEMKEILCDARSLASTRAYPNGWLDVL